MSPTAPKRPIVAQMDPSSEQEPAILDRGRDVVVTAGAGTGKTWDASSDPVSDVDTSILQVIKACAFGSVMNVGVLFGATAWKIFKNAAAVRNRFVVGSGGKAGVGLAVPSEQSANQLFIGTPEVRTSYMVYDTQPEGKAADYSFLLDSTVLVFTRMPQPSRLDPSFMKTFRLMNNYMVPSSYVRDDGRVEVAKFDWSEDVKVTNTAAAVRLNISA